MAIRYAEAGEDVKRMGEVNAYYLMNKDRPLTMISFTQVGDIISFSRKYRNEEYLPVVSRGDESWLYSWWQDRKVPLSRNNIRQLLESKGVSISEEYLYKNLGLSLTDSYWIKPFDSDLTWADVNLYYNVFKDNTLEWDTTVKPDETKTYSPNSSLKGNVEKTWTMSGNNRYLIKGNRFMTSSESINEVIATEIHKRQKHRSYSKYKLTKIAGKPYDYGCSCRLFTDESIELITAYELMSSEPRSKSHYEHLLDVCEHNYIDREETVRELDYQILTDHIMSQTDRHFGNFGFLRDSDSLKFIGMAPIYDSGESMYANTTAPENERDLSHLMTKGFATEAEQLLEFVHDPYAVDLTLLPPVSYLEEMYAKDSKESSTHIKGICYAYEKRIDQIRHLQLSR